MEIRLPHYAVDYTFMAMDGNKNHPRGEFWTETVECNETGYVSRRASKYNELGDCRYRTVMIGRSLPYLVNYSICTIKEEHIVAMWTEPNRYEVYTTAGIFTIINPRNLCEGIYIADNVVYDR